MKGNTATLYVTRDSYGDAALYTTKPKVETTEIERYSLRRGFYTAKERGFNTDANVYTLSDTMLKTLTGRAVPRGKLGVAKITIRKNSLNAKGKKLFAAGLHYGGVELFTELPKIVTEKEPTLTYYDAQMHYVPEGIKGFIKRKRIQSTTEGADAPNAVTEFCRSGFRRATGLSIPRNSITTLTVKVTPVKA